MNETEFQQWLAQAAFLDGSQLEKLCTRLAQITGDEELAHDPAWRQASLCFKNAGYLIRHRLGD